MATSAVEVRMSTKELQETAVLIFVSNYVKLRGSVKHDLIQIQKGKSNVNDYKHILLRFMVFL